MVPSLCAKSLSHFSKHTGVEHRRMTPLWPEGKRRGLTSEPFFAQVSRQIANLEGKNWRTESVTWLVAYQFILQATTGAIPSYLMFGREMRTKLLELRRETVEVPREEVRDRDWWNIS